MDKKRIIIVGGVAGGASCAARLRRLDEQAEITIYERSGYMSYANCGLPYFVGGVIENRGDLVLQTPASFGRRFNVAVKVKHEVVSIDREKKEVQVKDLITGKTFTDHYDYLVLAPGAKAIVPPLEGMDDPRVFVVKTVEDAYAIKDLLEKNHPTDAVVAGGGYIGVEMAENLVEAGLNVSLLQKINHIITPLDQDMAAFVHPHIRAKGVALYLGEGIASYKDGHVHTDLGRKIKADLLIMALGVKPEVGLAKEAGLKLGTTGGIAVSESMQTSDPYIYAVGDAVEIINRVTGKPALIALAGPANKEGRFAADEIYGIKNTYRGSLGSSVLKVFDLTVAMTGMGLDAALASGYDAEAIVLSPNDHASYYPGASAMTIKVIFDKKDYTILGAQAVGEHGVEKRIDVLATAMLAGLKATDLKDLDLCYAPPYSSAKDPVNMAGFYIENIKNGLVTQFGIKEMDALPRDGSVNLLDVRTPREYAYGHAPGFVNIPVDELRERLGEIDPTKDTYVTCQSGVRSYIACRILAGHGIKCFNFINGYRYYATVKYEEEVSRRIKDCGLELPRSK